MSYRQNVLWLEFVYFSNEYVASFCFKGVCLLHFMNINNLEKELKIDNCSICQKASPKMLPYSNTEELITLR